jgi:hypothetical protein
LKQLCIALADGPARTGVGPRCLKVSGFAEACCGGWRRCEADAHGDPDKQEPPHDYLYVGFMRG